MDGENNMPIEIYNLETCEWNYYYHLNLFRHASFCVDKYIFIHGGCDYENPLDPCDKVIMFNVADFVNIKR